LNDLRKVVVVGGDHSATLGAIDGLKQYEYGG
jgi:arginase family enzyme